jgi:transcriptional regulator with XRE-family HTH domain
MTYRRAGVLADGYRTLVRAMLQYGRISLEDIGKHAGCAPKTIARLLAGEPVAEPHALIRAADEVMLGRHFVALVSEDARPAGRIPLAVRCALASFPKLEIAKNEERTTDPQLMSAYIIALEAGLRWGAYRHLCGSPEISAELERAVVDFVPAGARRRGEPGDVLEHLIRARMSEVGFETVDALAKAAGLSRRALDGWLRGHRPITASAITLIVQTLTKRIPDLEASAFHLAVRMAAAVQDLQLRSGLDERLLRDALRLFVECARAVQTSLAAHAWGRRDVVAVLVSGTEAPLGARLLRSGYKWAPDPRLGMFMVLLSGGASATPAMLRAFWDLLPDASHYSNRMFWSRSWTLSDEEDASVICDLCGFLIALEPHAELTLLQQRLMRLGLILQLNAKQVSLPGGSERPATSASAPDGEHVVAHHPG